MHLTHSNFDGKIASVDRILSKQFLHQADRDNSESAWMAYAVFSPFTVIQLELQGIYNNLEENSKTDEKGLAIQK